MREGEMLEGFGVFAQGALCAAGVFGMIATGLDL
jgi:hypothetical protein